MLKKKIQMLMLISFLSAAGSMHAMEDPSTINEPEVSIVYTKHVREQMENRSISRQKIEQIIREDNKFEDTQNPGSVIYRERSKKGAKQLMVVTRPGNKPGQILVITTFEADTWGNKKPQKRR